MKRILLLLLALCLFSACPALAQRIDMDNAHVSFDYPDTWLVVSPQLCTTYARLLADAGLAVKRLVDRRQRNAQRRGDVLDRCPFHSRFGFRLPFLYCIYYNGKRGACQ